MFYIKKSDSKEIVELIYSGNGFCIIIDQRETLLSEDKNPIGRILRYGKKEFKKHYRKIKPDHKNVLIKPIKDEIKEQIISTFDTDRIGIMYYTEEYIDNNKYLERKREIERQTEADRARMLKELADDY